MSVAYPNMVAKGTFEVIFASPWSTVWPSMAGHGNSTSSATPSKNKQWRHLCRAKGLVSAVNAKALSAIPVPPSHVVAPLYATLSSNPLGTS